jgi:hypothetical protein
MDEPIDPRYVTPQWGLAKRVLFRFASVYFLLYLFPFPFDVFPIPYLGILFAPYQKLWDALVPWVGRHLFSVAITVHPNGSGDTTYNYVQVLCYLVIALLGTAIWSLLDRRRPNYVRLHQWLRVYVRFALSTVMISYGAVKVIKSQFPSPGIDRLLQPFGDSSPMGLLWTFMGASMSYNIFSGLCEMIGGLFLLARRTTLLGALFSMGVLANIVMLNFSYDVPVKLYSLHLFAMAVFLAWPDLRRLAAFFLLNRPVEPAPLAHLFERTWLRRGGVVLRTVFVFGFAALSLYGAQQGRATFGDLAPRPPLYGIWNVDDLEFAGKVRPPTFADETRWRRVIFSAPGQVSIQLANNARLRYNLKLDQAKGTLEFAQRQDPRKKFTLTYKQPGPGLLTLEGTTLEHETVRARLHWTKLSSFPLLSRGFHWINEFPYNL